MAPKQISEKNKRPGVIYTYNSEGVELPVIDITNPAFHIESTKEILDQKIDAFLKQQAQHDKMPKFFMDFMMKLIMRNSVLGQAVMNTGPGFLSGMSTYLMKLGPDNLGAAYTVKVDRMIADSPPAFAMRLRLQDMARLLKQNLESRLKTAPGRDVYMISIAGGPAPDCLNALILLQKENPGLLAGRKVLIHVLDLVSEGPEFGKSSLKAFQLAGAPLAGVDAEFIHSQYDWTKPEILPMIIQEGLKDRIVILSSEGGLFEYGDDETVRSNLSALAGMVPDDPVFIGSVTRDEGPVITLKKMSRVPTVPRNRVSFAALARSAGWEVIETQDGIFSFNAVLKKTGK